MTRIFSAALLCALAFSCTQKPENYKYRPDIEADFEVEITPSDETLVLSDIVDGYELIEPKGVLLAYVGKTLHCDSLLFVSGKSAEKGYCHLFDLEGNFIQTILREGQGPDETTAVRAYKLHGDDLYCLADAGTKIMRYSLKEKRFVESFRLPKEMSSAWDFEVLGEDKYVFLNASSATASGGDPYKLYVYDKAKDEITHKWIPMKKGSEQYISIGQSDCLYQINGKYYFHEVFQKGIYELSADTLQGYISFKDNKYTMDTDVLYGAFQTFDEFMNYCFDNYYIWADRDFFEGEHFIMGNYQSGKTFYGCLIDKQQKTSCSFQHVKDDVLLDAELPVIKYYPKNVQGDVFYYAVPYEQLHEVMEAKKEKGELEEYAKRHPDVMQLYERMDEDSNGFIVAFHEKP